MDQDSRGAHQAAAEVVPHRGEMSFSQQLLTEHGRGGNSRGVPAAKGELILQFCSTGKLADVGL